MVATYIAFTFFVCLVLLCFTIILFICISVYDNIVQYNDPGPFKKWFSRIIIFIICYFFINWTHYLMFKPIRFISSDEPVLITGNNATYRYYNYFQTDSDDVIVHKPIYMKGIIYKDKVSNCSDNDNNVNHHDICIKSEDGKHIEEDYHYNPQIEDLPFEEYKKRVGFKKVFFPVERYYLIYFSK